MWCLGRRLDAHVVEIPRRPQRRRRRRKLPVLDTVVTRPCRVHLCVPRGGARHRARRCRGSTSPSSPPPPRHRHLPAQVRCRCRLRTAGCRPGFVCSAGFRARPLLVGRLSLVANRRTVVTAVICVLLSAVASRSVFSKCRIRCVPTPRLSMRETHSLTHVHKRVSAELVKHAPSGAPEPLICAVVAPRPCASPRHRAPIACAARTRVRSSASAVVTAVTAVTDGGMHGDLLEREAIGRASVM